MSSRLDPDAPASSARGPEATLAVTPGSLLACPCIQGIELDTATSCLKQAYQLPEPPTQQNAAPPTGDPVQLYGEECTEFAESSISHLSGRLGATPFKVQRTGGQS